MSSLTPTDIASASFAMRLRGYDPGEVREFLARLAEVVAELAQERDRLQAATAELGRRDLKTEFENLGREVTAVLEAARSAAGSMRERASTDASRWRAEAVAEAEAELRRARSDAEHLRGDAWSTADELLRQAQAEATRIREEADREALRVVGESELASHRSQAAARRESEELIRVARMEAERLLIDAQARHDQMIETAQRQADTAQERTRALESRRQELVKELELVRATLNQVEMELDERRTALSLSPPSPQAPAPPRASSEGWDAGESVRVVRPDGKVSGEGGAPPPPRPKVELEPSPEIRVIPASEFAKRKGPSSPPSIESPIEQPPVESMSGTEEVEEGPTVDEQAMEVVSDRPVAEEAVEQPVEEASPQEVEEPVEVVETEAYPVEGLTVKVVEPPPVQLDLDEVSGLFARLREPSPGSSVAPEPLVSPEPPPPTRHTTRVDLAQIRERRLLPVTNRALRNLKRQLTEEANVALDQIRSTGGGWAPNPDEFSTHLKADMVVLYAEAHGAGHGAAEEMVGERLSRPPTPRFDATAEFVQALVKELDHVLEEGRAAGQAPQQLGSAVSRVFRAWRTDEAERRTRHLAITAYHQGLAAALSSVERSLALEVSGRGCATCRAVAEEEVSPDHLPPFHSGCECVVGAG